MVCLTEALHDVYFFAAGQFCDEGLHGVADDGCELFEAFGGEVFVVDGTEGGVFGGVHAVGDGDVAGGDDVGVDFGVVEYVLYVGVFEDGVDHEFVVGDGAAAAHCVVGGYLVFLHFFASEVPVVVYVLSHCSPVFVIELWRAGCGRPGDAYGAGSGVHFST